MTLDASGAVGELPARLPMVTGDSLAIEGARTTAYDCQLGFTSRVYAPPLVDWTYQEPVREDCALLVEADVETDWDLDEFGDESQDNCPNQWNGSQADADGDGLGDACDYGFPPGYGPPWLPTFPPGPCGPPEIDPKRDYQAASPRDANPLVGERWFIDPEEYSYKDWEEFKGNGQTRKAKLMGRIAREPKFRWFGKFSRPRIATKVSTFLQRAACTQPRSVPLIAVMRGLSRQCHAGYTGGGAAEDERHRQSLRELAAAIGEARVVIAYEPDSLGTLDCLKRSRRRARLEVLRYGVTLLSRLPNATVYLEAGASDWEDAGSMARKLRFIGIRKVRGFMLNVTHSDWTRANEGHGMRLSRLVGGKHFVINTSISGRGPTHAYESVNGVRRRINIWCNAPRAGLGPRPTTKTGNRLVDAYLWIGRPGYSGGDCFGGPLPIGTWWRERALKLAARASQRKGP